MSEAQLSVPVSDKDHSIGPVDAKITLVEYGDYECPYCGQAFPIVEKIGKTFGDSLRFVFRNLPIPEAHPHAEQAAEMAEAVGLQGEDKFWAIHDMIYEHQHALGEEALFAYAKDVGADVDKVRTDLAQGAPSRRVEADFESAIRSGANGTPTFFVNGDRYDGSWSYEPFETHLHEVLRELS